MDKQLRKLREEAGMSHVHTLRTMALGDFDDLAETGEDLRVNRKPPFERGDIGASVNTAYQHG
jgi:hypothetical protein